MINEDIKIKRKIIKEDEDLSREAPLKLYNTMSREKELFKPLREDWVGFYSCGPTVYHYAHIGNLRAYVFADTLKRVLQFNGYKVRHVMNITDVGHLTSDADEGEDKLEKGAAREGKSVWEIAEFYTKAFKRDISLLNIEPPTIWCKATEHIKEQIAMVECLEKKGYTYRTSDGIYFDTAKLDDYGKLAKLKIEDLKAGARVDLGEKKRKTDFALWKFSPTDKKRQMEWESPWGVGFPGWHIECSAMSSKYLGEQFDIHSGGIDHIPVHHTNEIAQSEACFEKKPWVKYWMHVEFLVMDEGKMSKSSGEFLTLQSLIDKGFNPLAYRYFLLNAHYRQQLKFSITALEGAVNAYKRLKNKIAEIKSSIDENERDEKAIILEDKYFTEFLKAINDDLNTPQALGVLWTMIRDESLPSISKLRLLEVFDPVLGLNLLLDEEVEVPEEVLSLALKRAIARKEKNWELADELREEIKKKGYLVKDKKDGSFDLEPIKEQG